MGLFSFFKRKTVPAQIPSPIPSREENPATTNSPDTTHIDREHFMLQAPFEWKAVPSDQPLEFDFRNQTLPEQLIVTVLLARERFSGLQLQQVAEQLSNTRLNALARLSEGKVVASPVNFMRGSGQVEARCIARDDANKVQYAWVIRVAPDKVVTVAITRFMIEEAAMPFDAYTGVIFDFLQVKNPGT